MPKWSFGKESATDYTGLRRVDYKGANSALAAPITGNQPFPDADVLKSKRNVVATSKGWVRRLHKKTDGVTRQIDEVLVAAHPGNNSAVTYAGVGYLGFPDIAQIYLANSTVDNVTSITALDGAGGSEHQICVVYNEPIKFDSAVSAKVLLANTASGNNALVALTTSAVNSNTNIINANNTLVLRFTPTAGDAGTYKIAASATAVANAVTGALAIVGITSLEAANTTLTGAVSNNFIFTIVAG